MEQDSLRWLYDLEQFGVKLGLDTMRRILEDCGHPERSAPSILIGGTNGKGSVAAYLDAILGEAGRRVGLYTSPHLVRPNERIRIRGADLETTSLALQLSHVRRLVESQVANGTLEAYPSFFETITTAAFLAFAAAGIDIAVLEVGLGGRLDATNVVDAVVSVIVSVDLDHTDRLGATIPEIAREKAGIIKSGRPLVSGVAEGVAVEVLRAECERQGATFVAVERAARIVPEGGGRFTIETGRAEYRDLAPGLAGRHQLDNARVAIVAAEELTAALGVPLPPEAVRSGLARVRWPGRLQWVGADPPVLLDGAHNPAGAQTLAVWLRERSGPRPVLLFGAMAGKDVAGILRPLAGLVERVILTRPHVERAASPEDLRIPAAILGVECEVVPDPAIALVRAREAARPGYVVVAGSLYLVGEILASLEGTSAHPISM